MSKVKKGKRVAAAAMAVALSMATVTTGVLPNSGILVRADETNKKLADSSVDGFYYQNDQYGDVQCTTDRTYVYTSYDEAVKNIGTMAKKIYLEDKFETK